jgi:hypothetical protein
MPSINVELPQVEDVKWEDLQFQFNGKWIPDVDPALIGPENYATLQNLRYLDAGLEGVNGYSKINTTALTTYVEIRTGFHLRSEKTQRSYTLVQAVDSGGQGRVYVNRTAIGSQGDFDSTSKLDTSGNAYFQDASTGLTGRFSSGPQGNAVYTNSEESMIFGGDEQPVAAVFTADDNAGTNPKDQTKKVKNQLQTTGEKFTFNQADQEFIILMTTRPIQSVKYYVSSANASASSQTIKYWDGSAWSADQVDTDGTKTDGKTLAQTGVVTLSAHTDGSVKPYHFEELFLYAYLIELSAGSADIYHMTVDFAMQKMKDVWDGVYRQPVQCQMYDNGHYEDFTLQVNDSSDINTPVGLVLNGHATATDHVIIMFEEPVAGIRFTMLGDMINTTAATLLAVKFWNGSAFAAVTDLTDGTKKTIALDQSGLMSWTAPTTEQPRTMFGSYGYAYELTWDKNISGAKDSDPPTVVVDIVTGVPQQKTVQPFDWPVQFKNRMMLGSFSKGDEGNRMDFSVANAPDAWNGSDSSDDNNQSIYFGGVDPIIAGTQLYNRFGANVFAMLLVLKKTETYILVGDSPSDFTVYPVSLSVGCAAPQTLAEAEVGLEIGQGLNRNAAIWVSHSGPIMFDGALLQPIRGVENYFDPNEDEYINWASIDRARGWVDPIYKEYNLLIPSGTAQIDCNVWLCYDLVRKKWFEKTIGTASMPQAGWLVTGTTGERRVYGGINTGYMMYLENDTSWDGVGIDQRVKTGDFFPSNNIWDITRIRKFKILMNKLPSDATVNKLEVHTYIDTDQESGMGLIWEDDDTGTGIDFEWADWADFEWTSAAVATFSLTTDVGLQRLIKANADLNQLGYAHAFEMRLLTDDVVKGFRPVAWGIRYRVERKDDIAT